MHLWGDETYAGRARTGQSGTGTVSPGRIPDPTAMGRWPLLAGNDAAAMHLSSSIFRGRGDRGPVGILIDLLGWAPLRRLQRSSV